MSVINAKGNSEIQVPWNVMQRFIMVKNHMSVTIVVKYLPILIVWKCMKECTQEKNHMNARFVANNLLIQNHSKPIIESILVKNHFNASIVTNISLGGVIWRFMKEFTHGKSHFNVISCFQKTSNDSFKKSCWKKQIRKLIYRIMDWHFEKYIFVNTRKSIYFT